MASVRTSSGDQRLSGRLGRLEKLVDELVKDAPSEVRIRSCMEAAGLKYTRDPIGRMSDVLCALDRVRANSQNQMKEQG